MHNDDNVEINRWPEHHGELVRRRRERRPPLQREHAPPGERRDGLEREGTDRRPVDGAAERARLIAAGLLTPGTAPADGAGLIPFHNIHNEPVLRTAGPLVYYPSRPERSKEPSPRRVR
jgi:hypothetical protein